MPTVCDRQDSNTPAPSPPVPSTPVPADGVAYAEASGAVAWANEAGGLDNNDDASISSVGVMVTPKRVMTPRNLTALAARATSTVDDTGTDAISTENDEDGDEEDIDFSDDESWTPSVGEEEDDDDDDEDQTSWKAQPVRSRDFSVGFNVTDHRIEEKYLLEVKVLTKHLLIDEFASTSSHTNGRKEILNENDILNMFFTECQAIPILTFMNRNLQRPNMSTITFQELQPFMRSFYALCYYKTKIADVKSHPDSYPVVTAAINNLNGNAFHQKFQRLNDLMRSFDGHDTKQKLNRDDECLFFAPVYGIDRDLEQLFRDLGGQASRLAYIEGLTNGIIDDEKTRGRSNMAVGLSLARSKSSKAFGPVGNCLNSMRTGIPLATHCSHFGESATDIVMANCCIITGATSQKTVDMKDMLLGGDRGYNGVGE